MHWIFHFIIYTRRSALIIIRADNELLKRKKCTWVFIDILKYIIDQFDTIKSHFHLLCIDSFIDWPDKCRIRLVAHLIFHFKATVKTILKWRKFTFTASKCRKPTANNQTKYVCAEITECDTNYQKPNPALNLPYVVKRLLYVNKKLFDLIDFLINSTLILAIKIKNNRIRIQEWVQNVFDHKKWEICACNDHYMMCQLSAESIVENYRKKKLW